MKERQREGIALAKQRGAYRGRRKALSTDKLAELRLRVNAGEKKAPLARELGISRQTLYESLRRAAESGDHGNAPAASPTALEKDGPP